MRGRFIVPVEPAARDGEVVVVEVLQEGSHPLDVRLVACEGESPYVTKISHRNISKLKHKFKGTADEWEQVLSHFLLQKQPEGDGAKLLENVRMVYTLKGDNIEITIQQDVKGIKVNQGEIWLPRDDEFEFNPFEWAQASALAHKHTLQELAGSKTQAHGEQDTIAKLNAQLDDFIKTKNETETAMLQQFMQLLNEKKRKIRDQNRLLATAKVDKDTATTVQAVREETKPRKAAASRTSKRKAKAPEPEPEPEPEQLSDEDQMEIDQAKTGEQDDDSDEGGAATPDRASDTETEDEGEGGFSSKAPAPTTRATRAKPAAAPRSSSLTVRSRKSTPAPDEDAGPPPPRRELPFGRPATRSKPPAKQPAPVAADEDDETEDEEL
ncbi:hypothetical protein P171DRAFT_432673 [Karstenula rhodostoma CBS 690.94]|uniref:Uncharacterized protein n=1 Tax=Karstenula rhodostoma CBS 690.94 TaxID=1392251 RepID=A0A9P4PE70_9PLEO|nr:hypothetical protein P171DRAFT_432673 [Karstenula rhodostoma CBS 690.94]